MPVLGSTRSSAIFILLVKGFDLKVFQHCADLVFGMKGHIGIDRPRISNAKELTCESSVWLYGSDNLIP